MAEHEIAHQRIARVQSLISRASAPLSDGLEGARVLFIAAEDANGVAKTRLPAARRARGMALAGIDPYWRTEAETFDLLSETDREELIKAYWEFDLDLIVIDVLTRVVTADINAPETGMRIMQSVYDLAAAFGATVVIAHHPGLNGSGAANGLVTLHLTGRLLPHGKTQGRRGLNLCR